MEEKKKKFSNPFMSMRSTNMDEQAMRQLDNALETKKMTPEQINMARQLKNKINLRAKRIYED